MSCIKVTGINRYQTKKVLDLINAIPQICTPKESYSIAFQVPVNLYRQDSLWYGGTVAEIYYKGFTFSVEAVGDIRAYLHDIVTDTQVFDVKDRYNGGALSGAMLPYVKSDKALEKALSENHGRYQLHLESRNWWEVFGMDNNSTWLNETWLVYSEGILSAVVDALSGIDEYLHDV